VLHGRPLGHTDPFRQPVLALRLRDAVQVFLAMDIWQLRQTPESWYDVGQHVLDLLGHVEDAQQLLPDGFRLALPEPCQHVDSIYTGEVDVATTSAESLQSKEVARDARHKQNHSNAIWDSVGDLVPCRSVCIHLRGDNRLGGLQHAR